MSLAGINDWLIGLGTQYGVNPYAFGAIYVGAIPFFLASIAWLVKRKRAGRSITFPMMCAGFCFVSAYLYLAVVGRNIPAWVWLFLAVLIAYGAWSTIQDVKRKTAASGNVDEANSEEVKDGGL